DDVQIGLSPGDFAGLPPSAVRFHPALDESLALMLMAQRPLATGGSYALEAEIPWSILLGSAPQLETNYGLCLSVSDNDQPGEASQDSLVSHCTGLRVVDPTTWLTVRFLR
ncbi:MAG: hypothetical protein IT326_00330, partial [Anaerolineae bacterium]|nr:hypothetical protein [Anaerolineae bacterium]